MKHPGASFGRIFGKGKEVKGAYRLIENPQAKSQYADFHCKFLVPLAAKSC
ncbi:MAG: hypothetical protein AB1656_22975 [Candidatus Omnitrophota bacterium]